MLLQMTLPFGIQLFLLKSDLCKAYAMLMEKVDIPPETKSLGYLRGYFSTPPPAPQRLGLQRVAAKILFLSQSFIQLL